jgi:hypothetical protein
MSVVPIFIFSYVTMSGGLGAASVAGGSPPSRAGHSSTDWPAGLTRYDDVLSEAEQAELVAFAEQMLARGRAGLLAGKSYLPVPDEWVRRGQGRETVHFGVLVKCNKVLNARVEPMLPPLAAVAARLVERGILTPEQAPDCVCLNVRLPPFPAPVCRPLLPTLPLQFFVPPAIATAAVARAA